MEKTLPFDSPQAEHRSPLEGSRNKKREFLKSALGAAFLLYATYAVWRYQHATPPEPALKDPAAKCAQSPTLVPVADSKELKDALKFLSTDTFRNESSLRLSGAVQVRTESYDDLGAIGQDERWDVFYGFHGYLEKTFPLTHQTLKLEKVNTHGLLYTWTGSNESLKPTLLMAHQDVVPVNPETVDSWTHPPYDGFIDGKYIWGRGAVDCKNNLIAIMETVEMLVQADFKPQRTVLLSFGFDEECSGRQGAQHLAAYILERYGPDGIATIVDEGLGYEKAFGRGFAAPGVAEKGYTDVDITVHGPGGHSSIPLDHTTIGILSELITEIEANRYQTYLDDTNPYLSFLSCTAEYAPDFPKKLKHLLRERQGQSSTPAGHCHKHKPKHDKLATEVAKLGPGVQYLMQTSQAVDLIQGGVKINAMPETARATVNHRINFGDTPEDVWAHVAAIAGHVAHKYNFTLHAFPDEEARERGAERSIVLTARPTVLRTAPVSPLYSKDGLTPYEVLAGTTRALYGDDLVVAPAIMTGNTDTRYYWDLSRHIFRFGPGMIMEDEPGVGNIHTVNERVSIANHVASVKWFMLFVRNMDELEVV